MNDFPNARKDGLHDVDDMDSLRTLSERAVTADPTTEALVSRLRAYGLPQHEVKQLVEALLARLREAEEALRKADYEASVAHDAIYAEPFDRDGASAAIWAIHNVLRPALAASPGGTSIDTRYAGGEPMDETTLPDAIYGFGSKFHLRDDFHFARAGDKVLIQHGDVNLIVPVNEWASAIAATTAEGENSGTFQAAMQFLDVASPGGGADE